MRRLALPFALVALLAFGACGSETSSGERSDQGPEALLERGLATDVSSGEFALSAQLTLEGGLVEVVELELDGPFEAYGPKRPMPDLDWDFTVELDEEAITGKLVVLPDNAYVVYNGEPFEVGEQSWRQAKRELLAGGGPTTFDEAKVEPLGWVSDLELAGRQRLAGAQTRKVDGRIDVGRVLADMNLFAGTPGERLSDEQIEELTAAVGETDFSASIGDDGIWRRLSTTLSFTIPKDTRASLGGVTGGELQLDVELDNPNRPQRIERPLGDPEPIANLLQQLGLPTDQLGIAPPAQGS